MITFQLTKQIQEITDEDLQLPIQFSDDKGIIHFDSVNIPRDENNVVILSQLNDSIDACVAHVNNKFPSGF